MPQQRSIVFDRKIGIARPVLPQEPILSTSRELWRDFFVEEYCVPSGEANDVFRINTAVTVQLDAPLRVEWKEAGRQRVKHINPGDVNVCPANVPFTARFRQQARFVTVGFESSFLSRIQCESFRGENFELAIHRGICDPAGQSIVLALRDEAASGAPSGQLYADSLATALAAHLFNRYCTQKPKVQQVAGGLSSQRLRKAIDFIQEHLTEDCSLADIAKSVALSPYHFSRMFKQSAGLSPHQYLLRRRLERAKVLLLQNKLATSEIASELGFADQSHLNLHFKRLYGVTPRKFVNSLRK